MTLLRKYFGHASWRRKVGLIVIYSLLLSASLLLAYVMRFDFSNAGAVLGGFLMTVMWIVPLKIALLILVRHFDGMLTYFRMPDLVRLFQALTAASLIILGVALLSAGTETRAWFSQTGEKITTMPSASDAAPKPKGMPLLPRGVILADLLFSLILVSGFRIGLRMLRERYVSNGLESHTRVRVAILGAGDVGATLAAEWLAKPGLGRIPSVFLDDDSSKQGLRVHGIPVVGRLSDLAYAKEKYAVSEAVLALGKTPVHRVQEVVKLAKKVGLKAEIMPSMDDLATGHVKASRVRPVDIQDLLGREPAKLDCEKIRQLIHGKVVMVTGAGGSIGSELCRQIAANSPAQLLLVEQCEVQLFVIEQNLISLGFGGVIQPLVADILDEERMRSIFELFRPQVIYHAAAHKHVFMMERQPWEAVKNNSFGTRLLADLSAEYEVERFVLVSTDKAINPTNAMGASKRLAEIYLQAKFHDDARSTKFMAVRFGNVLGSSGSVIPIFRQQIANGGPVKVTHPDVTRYFMTIPEAVGLVLQCSILGDGGEIFVLDMGHPVKIADLARQMIELSGFRPDIDIRIEYIGLRPGEKLYEELQHKTEVFQPTEHLQVMRFVSTPMALHDVESAFAGLKDHLHEKSANDLKEAIQQIVPEYQACLVQ